LLFRSLISANTCVAGRIGSSGMGPTTSQCETTTSRDDSIWHDTCHTDHHYKVRNPGPITVLGASHLMKKILSSLLLLVVALCAPRLLFAQDASSMTGVVTDSSGAVVPDAVVTLTNKTTGAKYSQTTNGSGSYRFENVPPGSGYDAVFARAGFANLDVQNIYLTVATTRTQNATLVVSANLQEVVVTASSSEVTIDTSDASIGNNFDVKLMNELPVQQRNDPTALFTLQPGVTDTGSTTGARVGFGLPARREYYRRGCHRKAA
jgi:hypothetical protein